MADAGHARCVCRHLHVRLSFAHSLTAPVRHRAKADTGIMSASICNDESI
jgi:hypothetical protein